VVNSDTGPLFVDIHFNLKGLVSMTISRRCKFYRDSEGTSIGRGLGYCDFDGSQGICDGDMQFCEKPDALKKYLLEQNNNGKVLGEGKNSFQ